MKITDKMMLDWLTENQGQIERNMAGTAGCNGYVLRGYRVSNRECTVWEHGRSPRQAIDAAIRASRKKVKQ